MRIQTARPSSAAFRATAPQTKPVAQPPLDTFVAAKKPIDRSAAAAMARLEKTSGSITGDEMRAAILEGIKDKDAHGASSELSTIQSWGSSHAGRLTTDAKEVLAAYAKIGNAAHKEGHTGLSTKQVTNLKAAMALAAQPLPGKDDHVAYALAHPNEFFKRQAYSAKYNPHPDELRNGKLVFATSSGNCGPTSLAMAVKAFGLEEKRASKNPEDSIDLARNAMTLKSNWDTLREPSDNHVGTQASDILRGAQRLGLKTHVLPVNKHSPLTALDDAFKKGRMVLLGGQPGQPGPGYTAYEQAMRSRSGKTDYAFDAGHSILVMGKDPQGRYLVADPLSRNGVVHMTAKEMGSFEQWYGAEVSK